jgi:lsr operon transcriptional repressor
MAALSTILHAAWLYYEDGLTQAEIADELGVSRATIGRLLDEARRGGIVTFQFHSDRLEALSLSQEIKEIFGLRAALVIPDITGSLDQKAINDRVAKGAAQYLTSRIESGSVLALGWGDTVSRTINAMQHAFAGEVMLVTMTGGANAYVETLLGEAERAPSFRVRASIVPAPIIASSPELARALGAEKEVKRILFECTKSPYALVGVGTPTAGSTLTELGYVEPGELREIRKQGAVGDILGQFFDADGKVLDISIHRRRIGIDIADLRGRRDVIAVAGGTPKVPAMLAAIKGGFFDVLVTDESAARAMLKSASTR